MKTLGTMLTLICVCAAGASFAQSSSTSKGSLALVGGTIYLDPASKPIKQGVVVIQDGLIVAAGDKRSVKVPKGMTTLDCTGLVVTAGFWNSHVHFLERKWADAPSIPATDLGKQLQLMLTQYGFTSVFDTWSNLANTRKIIERVESGEIPGPRIRTTGEAIYPKRGAPATIINNVLGFGPATIPTVESATEAQAAVARLADGGADAIKMYAETFAPRVKMPEELVRVIVDETHRRGKLAFAHPTSSETLAAAVQAGVDVIVHATPQSPVWDASLVSLMKEKRVALIPTLKLWQSELRHDRFSIQQRFVESGVGQLRAFAGAGGTVLFGTDVGYMDDYDTAEEFVLMAKAGMDYRQILASLTTAPAERFGDTARLGRVAPGLVADLVVMREDPAKDVSAFAKIRYTIRDGKVIYSSSQN